MIVGGLIVDSMTISVNKMLHNNYVSLYTVYA